MEPYCKVLQKIQKIKIKCWYIHRSYFFFKLMLSGFLRMPLDAMPVTSTTNDKKKKISSLVKAFNSAIITVHSYMYSCRLLCICHRFSLQSSTIPATQWCLTIDNPSLESSSLKQLPVRPKRKKWDSQSNTFFSNGTIACFCFWCPFLTPTVSRSLDPFLSLYLFFCSSISVNQSSMVVL